MLEQLTHADQDPTKDGFCFHKCPQVLPDGEHVLFTNVRNAPHFDQIEVYSLETGKRRVLLKRSFHGRYLPTGHILYWRSGSLYAVAFDLASCEVIGPNVPVLRDVICSHETAQFTFAQDGSLAYMPETRSKQLEPVWVTEDGSASSLGITRRDYRSVSVSPDGKYADFMAWRRGKWFSDL